MHKSIILLLILAMCAPAAQAADSEHKQIWLNGYVVHRKGEYMFLADESIPNNSTGKLLLLAYPSGSAQSMLPSVIYAADNQIHSRFRGELVPANTPHPKGSPDFALVVYLGHPVGMSDTPPVSTPTPASSPKPPAHKSSR